MNKNHFEVIIKGEDPYWSFWISNPMGGYLQLTKDEVIVGLMNGSIVAGHPKKREMDKIAHLLEEETQED